MMMWVIYKTAVDKPESGLTAEVSVDNDKTPRHSNACVVPDISLSPFNKSFVVKEENVGTPVSPVTSVTDKKLTATAKVSEDMEFQRVSTLTAIAE